MATAAVAAFAPGTALAGLDDLTKNLTNVNATVDEVSSTTTEITTRLTSADSSAPSPATPAAVANTVSDAATPLNAPVTTAVPQAAPASPVNQAVAPVTTTAQQATAPLTDTVNQTLTPVTTAMQQLAAPVTETATQTVAPLVNTVQRAAAPIVTTVQQTAAPFLTTVAQVATPVLQTASHLVTPLTEIAQQLLAPVASTVDTVLAPRTGPPTRDAASLEGTVRQATTPAREAPGSVGGPTMLPPGVVSPALEPAASPTAAVRSSRPKHAPAATREFAPRPESLLQPRFDTGPAAARQHAHVSPTRSPGPPAPRWPFGFSASAPGGGASLFVPLFAVLAAMLLLAAQGVGRRLRPTLASPRLPILALSLERPG